MFCPACGRAVEMLLPLIQSSLGETVCPGCALWVSDMVVKRAAHEAGMSVREYLEYMQTQSANERGIL